MNKIKHNLKEAKEYILELSKAKRILYIISCLLFLIEYTFYLIFEIAAAEGFMYLFEYFQESFETLYSIVIYPLLYIGINIVVLSFKKINWISLIIMLLLRISFPGTLLIINLVLIPFVWNWA